MPDSREDYQDLTTENSEVLRKKIKGLRGSLPRTEAGKLSYKVLREKCRLGINESELSNFVNGRRKTLDPHDHRALVGYLFDLNLWMESSYVRRVMETKDYLYHAVTLFLNIGKNTQNDVRIKAIGTYVLYRPSTHLLGCYVRGSLSVACDDENDAVRTLETHRYSGEDGSCPLSQEYGGYLFRKDSKYLILSLDATQRALRIIKLHGIRHDDKGQRILTMRGTVMEHDMTEIVCLPIYLERTSGQHDKKYFDILPEAAVPKTILGYLKEIRRSGLITRY